MYIYIYFCFLSMFLCFFFQSSGLLSLNFPAQRSRVSEIWEMLRRRWIWRISRSRFFHVNKQKLWWACGNRWVWIQITRFPMLKSRSAGHVNKQKLFKSHVFTCLNQEDRDNKFTNTCKQICFSGRTCKSNKGSWQEKVKRASRWYWFFTPGDNVLLLFYWPTPRKKGWWWRLTKHGSNTILKQQPPNSKD